jgi:hypothetical protein
VWLSRPAHFFRRACFFGPGTRALPVGMARRKSSIFFSWMNLPLLKLRQAEETKIPGYTGTSFLTGKSQTADSRLQTRLGAWWVKGVRGIAWCWVFRLIGRIGSNSVSAPLGGRRLPAIFPKRCKAGGRAGSSWRWLLGVWLGGERCRSVWLSRPALSLSDVVLYGVGPFAGGVCWVGVAGRSHFVPTARGDGRSWRLPTFCPYGALVVDWNCRTEKCKM